MSLEKYKKIKPRADYILAIVVFGLSLWGLATVFSSSIVVSYEKFGHNYYYFYHQLFSLIIGFGVWLLISQVDYRFWKKTAVFWMAGILIAMLLVFMPGIGIKIGGAYRWINLGFTLFQPSEFFKIIFIIYFALWLEKRKEKIGYLSGYAPFIIFIGLISALMLLQPDMGTLMVILTISLVMVFIAGANLKHLAITLLIGLVFLGLVIKIAPYRAQRLEVFLNPTTQTLGASYHINQSLLAVGSGGLFGLGFGQSRQKYLYLPQAHTDSIFAILAEEMGFIRTLLFLGIFVIIFIRGFKIAKAAPDIFSRLVAVGITSWITIQTIINISATLGLLPLTGIPLPFVSYGGTALVSNFVAVGILMNISKQVKI